MRMILRRVSVWLACLLIAASTRAENDCGSMVRRAMRFRGTVLSVEPLGGRKLKVTPIDPNMEFAVSIRIDRVETPVEGGGPPLKTGETRRFGVHSPSRTFGSGKLAGTTLDLETEWMTCDGVFRRFVDIRVPPERTIVEEPDHWLEIGHTYRAEARWNGEELEIVTRIPVPHHHGYGFDWKNAGDFPQSARDGAAHPIVFEVLGVRITHWPADGMWSSIYEVKIVSVVWSSPSGLPRGQAGRPAPYLSAGRRDAAIPRAR